MTEELIVKHCSPTLAGLKTGNMFSCPNCCEKQLLNEIRKINICLKTKGVRLIPLKKQQDRMLLYLYRPDKLQEDLLNTSGVVIVPGEAFGTDCERYFRLSYVASDDSLREVISRMKEDGFSFN